MTESQVSAGTEVSASPAPMGDVGLDALIGAPTLQAIQDTFAQVFGLPTGIVNVDGSAVTTITNRVSFCEDLTKVTSLGCARCNACDQGAFAESARTQQPAIFECWNGLMDAAIPIAPKGQTIGYFLCGQVLSAPPDLERVRETARELGIDPDAYVEQAERIQVMAHDQYDASVQTMHVLAGMIAEQAAAYMDNGQILEQAVAAREETRRLIGELDGILEALKDIGLQPDHRATLHSIADNLATLIPHDSCVIYGVEGEVLQPLVVRDPQPEPLWNFKPTLGEGIVGNVAATRVARRCDEARAEPDFLAVPGLDAEPEAVLVAPIVDKADLLGVIVLIRLDRKVFTDHDLSILTVFASQSAVAIQRSELQAKSARRLAEERALADLLRAMTRRMTIDETLAEIARDGMALLAATSATVRAVASERTVTVSEGITELESDRLLDRLEPTVAAASRRGEPAVEIADGMSCLVIPLRSAAEALGVVVLTRRETDRDWDLVLVDSLASQASLGIANTLMHDRERRAAHRYRMLSELTSDVVASDSVERVTELLVTRVPAVAGADSCFVAMLEAGSEAIEVLQRAGRSTQRKRIGLAGIRRLAAARLVGEVENARPAFDTWAQDTWREIDGQLSLRTCVAEPLVTGSGIVGGVFVAWPEGAPEAAEEDRHTLRVVADSASARLAAIENQEETNDELRRRVHELQSLTQLAQRLTGLDDRRAIIDELLVALRELGHLDGAVYCTTGRTGVATVRRSLGLDPALAATVEAELRLHGEVSAPRRSTIRGDGEVLLLPLPGLANAFLAGLGASVRDPERDPVLGALARYGSVALERVRLQEQQRRAISRLERENRDASEDFGRLERILELNRELTRALLNASGPAAAAATIADVLGARVAVTDGAGTTLAASPASARGLWAPPSDQFLVDTIVSPRDGGATIAAPVVLDDHIAAWVAVDFDGAVTPIEQAAVEHAAVLVAVDRLREGTAQDVATRLRYGFLDELFSGEFVAELAVQRGLALGLDLRRSSRVYLIDVLESDHWPGHQRAVRDAVTEVARTHSEHIVAQFDETVVAIVAEESLDPEAPAQAVDPIEERIRRALIRLPVAVLFNIAAGTVCSAPAEYRQSHTAARRGLDFLRLVGRSNEVLSFRQPGVEQMLLQTGEPEALLAFVARYIEPLARYDAEHRAELRRTLEVLFAHHGRLEPAARALHVHVSTLRYRLERIEKLVGVNPRAGESRLDLEVALRAAQVLPIHGKPQIAEPAQTSS